MQKAKWLSEDVLQIAEKRREVKDNEEKGKRLKRPKYMIQEKEMQ